MARYVYYPTRFTAKTPFLLEYFPKGKLLPTAEIDMHSHIHLGIILAGAHDSWSDGYQLHFSSGDVWLTSPLEPHSALRQSADHEAIVASFLLEDLGNGFTGWNLPFLAPFSHGVRERHRLLNSSQRPQLFSLGKKLRDLALIQHPDECSRFEAWLTIHQIYTALLRPFLHAETLPATGTGFERIRPALMLPRKQPGIPVSLETAAKECRLSASRFGELFRTYTGTTFCQYEMRYRLSNAKNAVASSDRPFKEIASEWGFYDASHFLHIFRQYYGVTPGEYRKGKLNF